MYNINIVIVPELQEFLNPLDVSEFAKLEELCKTDGILDPLKVALIDDQYILVDGFNRFRISQKHNIPYKTEIISCADLECVKRWMADNQVGRRNVSKFRRFELIRTMMPKQGIPNSREHLIEKTGMSNGAVSHADYVLTHSTEEIKEDARKGIISIHQAYQRTRKKETPQDYKDTEKLINQVPYPYKADVRMQSVFVFFELYKNAEKSHIQLAKDWQVAEGVTEDQLPVDTIVKNYVRFRDQVRINKEKILQKI